MSAPDDLPTMKATAELDAYDPRDPHHDAAVCALADQLLEDGASLESLTAREHELDADAPLAAHLAIKLARSKATVRAMTQPAHVSVVFAMYKEHTRILRPVEHPHGEDFVVRKLDQLRWLFEGSATLTWDLLIVDDGCPEGSGRIAQQVLTDRCPDAPVRVLFLEDGVRTQSPPTRPMQSAADSQKGGSIAYGMWTAAQDARDGHIIVFTDADLSTHLGQTGLLVEPIVRGGMDAAIGSRREATSVVIKQGQRNTRGKLFIYLWKSIIEPLHRITDTQCGFKAFTADTVRDIIVERLEQRFAFDIELLLRAELRHADSIAKVPIAWIDSEAASTTTGLQPYLPMLRAVVAMYRRYLPASAEADRFADFIDGMSETMWQQLVEHVPGEIADADPSDFGRCRPVAVDELIRAATA